MATNCHWADDYWAHFYFLFIYSFIWKPGPHKRADNNKKKLKIYTQKHLNLTMMFETRETNTLSGRSGLGNLGEGWTAPDVKVWGQGSSVSRPGPGAKLR